MKNTGEVEWFTFMDFFLFSFLPIKHLLEIKIQEPASISQPSHSHTEPSFQILCFTSSIMQVLPILHWAKTYKKRSILIWYKWQQNTKKVLIKRESLTNPFGHDLIRWLYQFGSFLSDCHISLIFAYIFNIFTKTHSNTQRQLHNKKNIDK